MKPSKRLRRVLDRLATFPPGYLKIWLKYHSQTDWLETPLEPVPNSNHDSRSRYSRDLEALFPDAVDRREWNEADHPRVPAGCHKGGRFRDRLTGDPVEQEPFDENEPTGIEVDEQDEPIRDEAELLDIAHDRGLQIAGLLTPLQIAELIGPAVAGANEPGHHWFSQSIITKLRNAKLLPPQVLDYFQATTTIPAEYIHRFDTWNDVTHGQYIGAVEIVARKMAGAGKLRTVEQAEDFLKWIVTGLDEQKLFGSLLKDPDAVANMKLVRRWATGFFKAEFATKLLKEVFTNLSDKETKEFGKAIARGAKIDDTTIATRLRKKYAEVLSKLKEMEASGALRVYAGRVAKGAAKALGAFFMLASAASGSSGAGHNPNLSGVVGAADQVLYDLIMADYVESIVKSVGDSVAPFAGVADNQLMRAGKGRIEAADLLETGVLRQGSNVPKLPPKPKPPGTRWTGWLSWLNAE